MSKHRDELIAINEENDKKLKQFQDEKLRIEQSYEIKLKMMKDDFNTSLEQKQKEYDKKLQGVQKDFKEKYDKKCSDYKEKVKQQHEAINEENNKKFEEKLKFMFDKMHGEYETQQIETAAALAKKQEAIDELGSRLETYTKEIDKWKQLYLDACTMISNKQDRDKTNRPEETYTQSNRIDEIPSSEKHQVAFTFRNKHEEVVKTVEKEKEVFNEDEDKVIPEEKNLPDLTKILQMPSYQMEKLKIIQHHKETMTDMVPETHRAVDLEKKHGI